MIRFAPKLPCKNPYNGLLIKGFSSHVLLCTLRGKPFFYQAHSLSF